ncbi:hypothetical protein CCACVL1_19437, partial [Corchorus capsularis]
MGGGAMNIDLPIIQFNSSTAAVPSTVQSSTISLNLAAPPKRPSSSTASSSSCQCHTDTCTRPLEAVDGNENSSNTVTAGSFNNYVLGPVPSNLEVENALAALQNFIHGNSSSRPELGWLQPLLDSSDSRLLQSQGLERAYDAFSLLLREPSVKRLVISLLSDKAVWDAVMSNELVRKLLDLPHLPGMFLNSESYLHKNRTQQVENGRPWKSTHEADLGKDILQWILDMIKTKVAELLLKFQSLLNEVFQVTMTGKPNEENKDQLEEKIRSSLLLSIVILVITLPVELTLLPILENLYLDNNKLSVLPPELGELKTLKVLVVDYSLLVSVPVELRQTVWLVELDV